MNKFLVIFVLFSGLKNFLKKELDRNFNYLIKTEEIKPYFILYRVKEINLYYLEYGKAGLIEERKVSTRVPYVELRVGNYKNDGVNTEVSGSGFATRSDFRYLLYPKFPIEDTEYAIRHTLWKMTDFAYKNAVKNLYEKKKSREVFIPKDTSASFSMEKPSIYTEVFKEEKLDSKKIKDMVGKFSRILLNQEFLYAGKIIFYFLKERRWIVNTEGTEIEDGKSYFLLKILVSAFDEEGRYYKNSKEIFGYKLEEVIGKESFEKAREFIKNFKEHVNSKEIKKYEGKAVLKYVSSAKFISNLVKNTLCLHKGNYENLETFLQKRGERITGRISIYDRPRVKYYREKPLGGFIFYDDEGVIARDVELIKDGILKNFLLKREPVNGFKNSNGHARAGLYSKPMPFLTNLFVEGKENREWEKMDSILIILDIEFKSPLSFEVKSGFILYKDGRKKRVKDIEISFSSFEEMWDKIEGVTGDFNSFNFFEGNPYIPFSVTSQDIILEKIMAKNIPKKKIRND